MLARRLQDALDAIRLHPAVSVVIGVLSVLVVFLSIALVGALSRETAPVLPATPTPSIGVLSPADGELTVGEGDEALVLPALSGECDGALEGGSSCVLEEGAVPTLTSAPDTLPLSAGESTAFNVSVVNTENPSSIPQIEVVGSDLDFSEAIPGLYGLTVLGDAGGVWKLNLAVTE